MGESKEQAQNANKDRGNGQMQRGVSCPWCGGKFNGKRGEFVHAPYQRFRWEHKCLFVDIKTEWAGSKEEAKAVLMHRAS